MFRLWLALVVASCCAVSFAGETGVLDDFDRTLGKEPAYESTPKYCLLALGASAETRVWMVEDGRLLYVDKNANGDLTDDGPAIEPSNLRELGEGRWDFNYRLNKIRPADGGRHTQFDLRRWNYADKKDSYGLSLSLDGKSPMYAGWFGTFWSAQPDTAPVIHFGGALTPKMLRSKEFVIGSEERRLSVAFTNPGSGAGATSRLSIDAMAPEVVPRVHIEWPTADGGAPRRTSHRLVERCCYWEFYTSDFVVPEGIVAGSAKMLIELPPDAIPFVLTTLEIDVPVVE